MNEINIRVSRWKMFGHALKPPEETYNIVIE